MLEVCKRHEAERILREDVRLINVADGVRLQWWFGKRNTDHGESILVYAYRVSLRICLKSSGRFLEDEATGPVGGDTTSAVGEVARDFHANRSLHTRLVPSLHCSRKRLLTLSISNTFSITLGPTTATSTSMMWILAVLRVSQPMSRLDIDVQVTC